MCDALSPPSLSASVASISRSMGDSVSPPLAILARPGSAPLPNTRFPIVGCVGQSSGGVGIDTRQYSATRLPNAQIEEFGEFGQGLTLARFPHLTFPRSLSGRSLRSDSVA